MIVRFEGWYVNYYVIGGSVENVFIYYMVKKRERMRGVLNLIIYFMLFLFC